MAIRGQAAVLIVGFTLATAAGSEDPAVVARLVKEGMNRGRSLRLEKIALEFGLHRRDDGAVVTPGRATEDSNFRRFSADVIIR
ncbi:MAG: hypothetical protein FJW38_06000 [Acidobacteria bacterium]|nr:hypothetical protein [Acidobacteriota bacterium]